MTAEAIAHARSRRTDVPALADGVALCVLVAVTLVTRILWFGDPVADFDEQLYSFIGWRITEGELPFVDWWDRKPAGLFAIFAFAHWIGGPGPLAYQILAGLFALGGAGLTYQLARSLVDRITACISGVLYLMLIAAYGSYSGQSEVFHVPMMLAMALLLRDSAHPLALPRAMAAMFIGGLALQVKYTVLPQCIFFGLYGIWAQWDRTRSAFRTAAIALTFAVLGMLPTALVAALYFMIGALEPFIFANFVSFFERAPSEIGRWRPDFVIGVAPLALLALPGLYAAFRIGPPSSWRTYGLYCGWGLSAVATVFLPSTTFLYYFAALVPPAILMSLPMLDRRGPLRILPAAIFIVGGAYILNLPARAATSANERLAVEDLASAIAPHMDGKRQCLWVFDGPTALYRLTGSCVPTRFVYPDHLNNALESKALGVDQAGEVARILETQPAAIVTADTPMTVQNPQALDLVGKALDANYFKSRTVELHGRKVTAWVRGKN